MKPRHDLKMYTLRHFLFYMAIAAGTGAVMGAVAGVMDWSDGLAYAVVLPVGVAIVIFAMREGLFGPTRRSKKQRHIHA